MEDVRTSESLEKEILEDARKKAERILKASEKSVQEFQAEWETKIAGEISVLEAEYSKKKAHAERELRASLPLEMKRKQLDYLNRRFEEALSAFDSSLGGKDTAELLLRRGKKAAGLLGKPPYRIFFAGLSADEARFIAQGLGARDSTLEENTGFRGIIIENSAEGVRYRLTLDEVLDELRESFRRPIIDAMFKGKY